jgi:hypothetical protein
MDSGAKRAPGARSPRWHCGYVAGRHGSNGYCGAGSNSLSNRPHLIFIVYMGLRHQDRELRHVLARSCDYSEDTKNRAPRNAASEGRRPQWSGVPAAAPIKASGSTPDRRLRTSVRSTCPAPVRSQTKAPGSSSPAAAGAPWRPSPRTSASPPKPRRSMLLMRGRSIGTWNRW